MKNPSFTPNGKTKGIWVRIFWLVLFFVLTGLLQIQAQTKRPKKPEPKPTAHKILITAQHRKNFEALKKYLNTLKPERGDIKNYSLALDSIMAIRAKEPLDTTRHNEWRKRALDGFESLDSTTQLKIVAFAATVPAPLLTPAELEKLGYGCDGGAIYQTTALGDTCCNVGGSTCCPCIDCDMVLYYPNYFAFPKGKQ